MNSSNTNKNFKTVVPPNGNTGVLGQMSANTKWRTHKKEKEKVKPTIALPESENEKKRPSPLSPLKDCWVVIETSESRSPKRTRSNKPVNYNEESADSDEENPEPQDLDQQVFKNYIDITPYKGRGRSNIRKKEEELYNIYSKELKELLKGKLFVSKTTDFDNEFVRAVSAFLWTANCIRIPFPKNWGEIDSRSELIVDLAKTKARAQLSVFPLILFPLPKTIDSNEKLYFLP